MIGYVNGAWIDLDAPAPLSPLDRGFLYGDGLFETIAVRSRRIEFLEAHLRRLAASARALDLPLPAGVEAARLGDLLAEAARRNGERDVVLRLALTRGSGGERLSTDGCSKPGIAVTVSSLPAPRPPVRRIRLATASFPRNERSPLARHKTLNVLESVLARGEARRKGADEALFLNSAGRVAEAAAANLFLVRDGRLVTPAVEEGALPGIVRAVVLEEARAAGIPVEERAVEARELPDAADLFLTNSIIGLAPVMELDGRAVGGREEGSVAARTRDLYERRRASDSAGIDRSAGSPGS